MATTDALKARQKLLFMESPDGVIVIQKPLSQSFETEETALHNTGERSHPDDRFTSVSRQRVRLTAAGPSHGSGFSDPVALDRVGRSGTLIHVHPDADLRRLIREHRGDLAVRNAGLF